VVLDHHHGGVYLHLQKMLCYISLFFPRLKRTVRCQNIPARRQNTPASTSVLMNPALLEQIILQLDGLFGGWGPAQQERNQALLWAAQTSKALFQPAINALWRTLSSLLPLLGVLPQFRQSGKYYVGILDLSGSISKFG